MNSIDLYVYIYIYACIHIFVSNNNKDEFINLRRNIGGTWKELEGE